MPAADRVLLAAAAAALLAILGWLLLRDGSPRATAVAAVLALVAVAGGARLQAARHDGTAPAAATLALTAAPLLAVAAYGWAGRTALPGETAGRLAAALAGVALGGLLAAVAVRAARPPGCALAGLSVATAVAVLLSRTLTGSQAAAVTAVVGVLAVPGLPRLVLRAAGLRLSDLERAGSATDGQLGLARRSVPWAFAAAGALVVGASAVLARTPRGAELPLAAVCGLLLVLRSRQRRGPAEVLPLGVAGHLALAVTGVGLALSHARQTGPLAVLAAVAAVYTAAAAVSSQAVDRPRWAQRRRLLEALALVALVPLLAATLGLFGAVVELARGAE